MQRTRAKRPPVSREQALYDLASEIVGEGEPEHELGYFALRSISVLIRLLPSGPEAALERLRQRPAAGLNQVEFGLSVDDEAKVVAGVLCFAECQLATYITKKKHPPAILRRSSLSLRAY